MAPYEPSRKFWWCEVWFALLCAAWASQVSCGVIRTHAVVSKLSEHSKEAQVGLNIFQETFREKYPTGFELGGFKFNFSHTADVSAIKSQADVVDAWDSVFNGTGGRGSGQRRQPQRGDKSGVIGDNSGPHFLVGTNAEYFAIEEVAAERAGRVMFHATAPFVVKRKTQKKHFYTMVPSRDTAIEAIITELVIKGITNIAVVTQVDDIVDVAACKVVKDTLAGVQALGFMDLSFKLGGRNKKMSVDKVVSDLIRGKAEVLVACTQDEGAKLMITTLWERKYPMKAQFYSSGPSSQRFIDEVGAPTHGVFSSQDWHPTVVMEDDGFFGSPRDFMYMARSEPSPIMAAAAAANYIVMEVFKASFGDCDISESGGDVDRMLFDPSAISCPSGEPKGYDRVLQELRFIHLDTIFGPVEFGKYGENLAGSPYITQVHGSEGQLSAHVVLPTTSSNTSLPWAFQLPWPNPFAPDECPEGTYTTGDIFEPCRKCPPGTHTELPGALECHPCQRGSYQPIDGQANCIKCPGNTDTETFGAAGIEDCICTLGYFHEHGRLGLPCKECPFGADCPGGIHLPIPMEGFWKATNTSSQIYVCDGFDGACTGGGAESCAEGYAGRLCGTCMEGYYRLLDSCYECRSKGQIVGMILATLVLWYFINTIVSLRVETVELTLNWAQLVSIIGGVQLNWPSVFQTIFSVASILDFDIDVIQPNCFFAEWSFTKVFAIQLLLPIWMSALAFLWYGLCVWRYRLQKHCRRVPRFLERILLSGVPKSGGREWVARKLDSSIARTLAAFEVTYITIARYCVGAMHCQDVDGVQVMSSAVTVECGTGEHMRIIAMAIMGLVVYTLGYLLFTAIVLTKLYVKKSFSDTRSLHRYGFIYERFELGYAWTAVMMLVIRILFVLSFVLSGNPLSAAAALALITVVWLLIHVYTLPYVEDAADILQTFLLVSLMALGYAGVMFSESTLPQQTKDRFTTGGALVIMLMVVTFLVLCFREVVQKIRILIIKHRHKRAVMCSLDGSRDTDSVIDDLLVAGVDLELYKSFDKSFLYNWLKDADRSTLLEFDRLSVILRDYIGDDSYLSFLSLETVARFWRKLLKGFPEIIDFLAMADDTALESFAHFVDVLYRDFFVYGIIHSDNLHSLVEWKDHAPLAQWLLICSKEERKRFANLMGQGYKVQVDGKKCGRSGDVLRRVESGGQHRSMELPDDFYSKFRSLTVKYRSALKQLVEQGGPLQHHTPLHKRQRTMDRMKQFDRSWRSIPFTGPSLGQLESIREGDVEEDLSPLSSAASP